MTTERVPAAYHAAITAKRTDLTTLRACWSEFWRHFSPRAVLTAVALLLVARVVVGEWSWRDVLPAVIVVAAQPFVEWVIHKYLLHLPPFRLRGRRIELYGSIQHRRHHRAPSDLDRVLLKPLEVVSFLIQIGVTAPLIVWASVALFGGHLVALGLTAVVVSYLGLLRYEWSHFLIHTPYVPRSGWYRRIWRNHRLHHFKHEGYWLGVSSNLGDRILRTNPDQRTVTRSATARTLGVETE
ncbi:MAG: sterol desaturase family protein [Actinomycetota bacterium]|nr:sterol desaturase family protein [Actinomycetota bacterium]